MFVFRLCKNIGHLHGSSFNECSPDDAAASRSNWNRPYEFQVIWGKTIARRVVESGIPSSRYTGHIRFAQPSGRFSQGVENSLEIKGRATNDPEHVGGGGLLL